MVLEDPSMKERTDKFSLGYAKFLWEIVSIWCKQIFRPSKGSKLTLNTDAIRICVLVEFGKAGCSSSFSNPVWCECRTSDDATRYAAVKSKYATVCWKASMILGLTFMGLIIFKIQRRAGLIRAFFCCCCLVVSLWTKLFLITITEW